MAAGDIYNQGITSVAAGSYFDIQPAAGVEVVIHNISHGTDCQLEFYDGTNFIVSDTHIGNGSWMDVALHCTNTKRYRVKNIGASATNIACDGVQTK